MSLLFRQRKYLSFIGVPWFILASKLAAASESKTLGMWGKKYAVSLDTPDKG